MCSRAGAWSATICNSTRVSAPAARKVRACRWAWVSRRCASTASPWAVLGHRPTHHAADSDHVFHFGDYSYYYSSLARLSAPRLSFLFDTSVHKLIKESSDALIKLWVRDVVRLHHTQRCGLGSPDGRHGQAAWWNDGVRKGYARRDDVLGHGPRHDDGR